MTLLGEATHAVTRTAPGSYVAGDFVPGASQAFDVVATLLPLSGRDLARLPEGERQGGRFKLLAEANQPLLRTSQDEAPADTVSADGRSLRVLSIADFRAHTTGIPHVRYLLGEPGEDGL